MNAAHDEPPACLSHAPQDLPCEGVRGLRVLLVDDDADLREALRGALEAADAEVVAAASVDEAIAALDRERPEVVVSDLGMPRRDGFDLIRILRARSPERGGDVPAIALTAFSDGSVRRSTLAAGFQRCAIKPIDPDVLVRTVGELAGRRARPRRRRRRR